MKSIKHYLVPDDPETPEEGKPKPPPIPPPTNP